MYPLGLESEYVHESVSVNVNELLKLVLFVCVLRFSEQLFQNRTFVTEIFVSGTKGNRNYGVSVLHFHCSSVGLQDITL